MALPKFFRPKQRTPQVQTIKEPKVSWHFDTILESQRFVAVAARDMIERKVRRITLENAETTTAELRAAIEAGDQLAPACRAAQAAGVGVVATTDEVQGKLRA